MENMHLSLSAKSSYNEGVQRLVKALLYKYVYQIYSTFNQIRTYRNEKTIEIDITSGNGGINRMMSFELGSNYGKLEKSKKKMEKTINLLLTIFSVLEGNKDLFLQYVLENYSFLNYMDYEKKDRKNTRKTGTENNNFHTSLWISQLGMHPYKETEEEEKDEVEEKEDFFEKSIKIYDTEIDHYYKKCTIIDQYINKSEVYSKECLELKLMNILNEAYLREADIELEKETQKGDPWNEEKPEKIDKESVSTKLFSYYFIHSRKNNKFRILMKEFNVESLQQFKNLLHKNIESVLSFTRSYDFIEDPYKIEKREQNSLTEELSIFLKIQKSFDNLTHYI